MEQKNYNAMMSRLAMAVACVLLTMTSCSKDDEEEQGPLVTTSEVGGYHFTNKSTFTKSGNGHVSRLLALMPIPRTNIYQRVEHASAADGQVLTDKNYGNQVVYADVQSFPESGVYTLETTFDVHPYKVRVDLSQIKDIKPYNPNSEPCRLHLGDRGEYVVTSHPYIVENGDKLWAQSSNVLDYARRCYEFVAQNLRYVNGSWRTLDQILRDGGGECGDFSTVVVSLLRYKGIPARHNICLKLSGGYHVWADFYLEGYGWIPLDAQAKNANPRGDYFGVYDGQCVVVMQDFCYDIGVELPFRFDVIQSYYYWYWFDAGECDVKGKHNFYKIPL